MEDIHPTQSWVGRAIPRVEDATLLTGGGRFIDDLGTPAGTLRAAILRSPHAHAEFASIDTAHARAADGVAAVITGKDVRAYTNSLLVGVRAPITCWPIATDRVRYVGEPVAVVVARDRYLAEDALDLIEVRYDPLPAVIDPLAALGSDAPAIHPGLNGNLASDRSFRYGDPKSVFADAPHHIAIEARYPRNACTPIETYGVIATYDAAEDAYDILANFQGPFSLHAVIARAEGAGQPPAAAHAARLRRQFWRQAGRVSVRGADGGGSAAHRAGGEMDRGPAGAPRRLHLRHQPRRETCRRGGRRRPRPGARLGPDRGLRRASAGARAGHALPDARKHDRRLRHPPCRHPQPRGADEQDADRAQSRIRRATSLFRARTADAAHRAHARARSAGGHPPQSGARLSISHRDRRPARFRRIRGGGRGRTRAGRLRRPRPPPRKHAPVEKSTASALPRLSNPASRTWGTSPPC